MGGPPLGGKSILASRLAECLPQAIKLETIDGLAQEDEFWCPNGPVGRAVADPNRAMLDVACRIWNRGRSLGEPIQRVSCRVFDSLGGLRPGRR